MGEEETEGKVFCLVLPFGFLVHTKKQRNNVDIANPRTVWNYPIPVVKISLVLSLLYVKGKYLRTYVRTYMCPQI